MVRAAVTQGRARAPMRNSASLVGARATTAVSARAPVAAIVPSSTRALVRGEFGADSRTGIEVRSIAVHPLARIGVAAGNLNRTPTPYRAEDMASVWTAMGLGRA